MVSIAQTKSNNNSIEDSQNFSSTTNNYSTASLNLNDKYDEAVKFYQTITDDFIYFKTTEMCGEFSVSVYDIYGNLHPVETNKGSINMSELKKGIYIILFTCKKFSIAKSIVVK
ncbi:hypothetical protein WPG_0198 [Winogradskyella sp. PG-2]|nr:hypothetical protein WPG_0198 [Winogradskyella sp. PG-2]